MIEYLPYIIATLSLLGSAATFILTSRQREAKEALTQASTAREITESWAPLVTALQKQVDGLEKDVEREKQLRRDEVHDFQIQLQTERTKRQGLEKEIAIEREERKKAELLVAELAGRVSALEKENEILKTENARLKKTK